MPPYLAGREKEQELFRALLGHLAGGGPPPSEIVLYGPRGNGKTALLVWLTRETAARGGVEVARRTPSEIPDRMRLAEELLPETWWERFAPAEVSVAGIRWRPGDSRPPSVRAVLSARSRNAPFVLLLDEAHTLDRKVGRELLNASQQVGRELPFLLVLAGTPNLRGHLDSMEASFWNRARRIPVGRLGAPAAAEALRRPLADEGATVEPEALSWLVRESHGYPYFVQLLGEAAWAAMAARGARTVTRETVEALRADFERTRNDYYLDRYRELEARELLTVGRGVAEAFGDRATLGDAELHRAIGRSLPGSDDAGTRAAREALSDLGFIWGSSPIPAWEPGIPSLMEYVRKHAPTC